MASAIYRIYRLYNIQSMPGEADLAVSTQYENELLNAQLFALLSGTTLVGRGVL